ncbi:MAG: universal stress protein [bacterium]
MQRKKQIVILVLLMAGISYLHFSTETHSPVLHLLHRELYLAPVFLAGFWFGRKVGVLVAAVASFLFLPWILVTGHGAGSYYYIDNLLEVIVYAAVGYFAGLYRDTRISGLSALHRQRLEAAGESTPEKGQRVLLCIDSPQTGLRGARFIARNFVPDQGSAITVLGVTRAPSRDIFRSQEAWQEAKQQNESRIREAAHEARTLLERAGFPPQGLRLELLEIEQESVARKILDEWQESFSTIVLGAPRMTKTQEFLFGNAAIKLVRAAACPVIAVP